MEKFQSLINVGPLNKAVGLGKKSKLINVGPTLFQTIEYVSFQRSNMIESLRIKFYYSYVDRTLLEFLKFFLDFCHF